MFAVTLIRVMPFALSALDHGLDEGSTDPLADRRRFDEECFELQLVVARDGDKPHDSTVIDGHASPTLRQRGGVVGQCVGIGEDEVAIAAFERPRPRTVEVR